MSGKQLDRQQQRKYFDYNNECKTREVRAKARKNAELGQAILKRTARGVWEMGKLLTETRELLGHGSFGRWIEAEFGLSRVTAYGFMGVFAQFPGLPDLLDNLTNPIAPTVFLELAKPSVSGDDREAAISLIQSGDIRTVADVKAAITPPKSSGSALSPTSQAPHQQSEQDEPGAADADETDDEPPTSSTPDESHDNAPDLTAPTDIPAPPEQPEPSTPTANTPAPPVKTVIYDTLSDKKSEDDLTPDEWLETLPIWRVLSKLGGKGIIARRSLLDYHAVRKALGTFAHHAGRCESVKHPDGTMFSNALSAIHKLPHPRDWQICAPCKGAGCNRCGFAGYDTSGAGISPTRIENGEVAL